LIFRPASVPPMRVLVADDCPDTRESLRLLLRLWGHESCEAADGEQAVALARHFRPDVALLDLAMPRLAGHGAAGRLRALLGGVVLVAASGWGRDCDVRRALACGFDLHLLKPADPQRLRELLERCGGGHLAGRAGAAQFPAG